MTRSDFIIKWGVYTLALVPVWILELYVLSRYPLFGVKPMLLPLAVVAVAVLEGSTAGGGFGLFVGVLCDACYHDTFGGMTLGLCLVGVCAGAVSRYALRQNLLGCLLCSLGGPAGGGRGPRAGPPVLADRPPGRSAAGGPAGGVRVPALCVSGVRSGAVGVQTGAQKDRAVGRPAPARPGREKKWGRIPEKSRKTLASEPSLWYSS